MLWHVTDTYQKPDEMGFTIPFTDDENKTEGAWVA